MSTGDISTAFLHADIRETVYVRPPSEVQTDGKVWRLLKALYGLKSSPKTWSDHLASLLTNNLGFTRSLTDCCLYYNTEHKTWVLVYVDDLFVVSRTTDGINNFFNQLGSHVLLKRTGDLTAGNSEVSWENVPSPW